MIEYSIGGRIRLVMAFVGGRPDRSLAFEAESFLEAACLFVEFKIRHYSLEVYSMKRILDAVAVGIVQVAFAMSADFSHASDPPLTTATFTDSGPSTVDLPFSDNASTKASDVTVGEYSSLGGIASMNPDQSGRSQISKRSTSADASANDAGASIIIPGCDELCVPGQKTKRRPNPIAGPLSLLAFGGVAWAIYAVRHRMKGA